MKLLKSQYYNFRDICWEVPVYYQKAPYSQQFYPWDYNSQVCTIYYNCCGNRERYKHIDAVIKLEISYELFSAFHLPSYVYSPILYAN